MNLKVFTKGFSFQSLMKIQLHQRELMHFLIPFLLQLNKTRYFGLHLQPRREESEFPPHQIFKSKFSRGNFSAMDRYNKPEPVSTIGFNDPEPV